jgi:putative membrane protein
MSIAATEARPGLRAFRMLDARLETTLTLSALLVLYAASRFLQVFPGQVPMMGIVALHVLCPGIFAMIHGALFYGVRGILTFAALCLLVGNLFENLGVLTGFPYGRYYFTDVMGPKLFAVPIMLGLAYLGMGYLSWTLARVILGDMRAPIAGSRLVTLPLIASFIMVAWDLTMDAVWSTIVHAWIWLDGGAYFGVPPSNFLGWYLAVYVFYQLFALYLRGRPANAASLPPGYWHLAVLFYAASAAGNLLLLIPQPGPAVVADAAGTPWKVNDIVIACALTSLFTMGPFALLAWVRLADLHRRPASAGLAPAERRVVG